DRAELGLHRAGLFLKIIERLQVPLVLLLIEKALLEVALDHSAIEIARRDFFLLVSHLQLLLQRGAGLYHRAGLSYRPCSPAASMPSPTGSTWSSPSSAGARP